ncbi:Bifunctional inhibitor/plant lipid transfer protein/seed storage helical domain [Macleaya cordata]|uniref:Bifunctional inhibitor/plant lipid transfer protein/seed storage helical domain n=1 Tax=Macleaya cordata TaxID=56857 RepID=A0A200QKQ9_MACCD|nr:Bifunctional inhibitor/plant lipid transfer protein/seed storage helical domain [Macleaya cordata]
MGSKNSSSSIALFLSLNLLFFTIATACGNCIIPDPTPKPKPNPSPKPKPNPTPTPAASKGSCARDTLKLGVCSKLLGGPVSVEIGNPLNHPCCGLLHGIGDIEAAVCLCTAIKANVLGINLNIPISLSLLINTCGKKIPSDFQCAL